jgi:hypothetical protein
VREKPKPEFKPFQKVLVRDDDYEQWRAGFFSHMHHDNSFVAAGAIKLSWGQCIPYEGNEHLLGTKGAAK